MKLIAGLFSLAFALMAGCAAPTGSGVTQSAPTGSGTTDTATVQPAGKQPTVWVSPPVGSLLGGGYVRAATDTGGNDEPGLISAINALDAAAGSKQERPFVVSAVARVSGLSERQVQTQQDQMQLRFGELLAFNTIARNHEPKVRELANLKARGKSWSELARANSISLATVARTVRNASDLTATSFTNMAERVQGSQRKLQELGVHPQTNVRPGG